MQKIYPTDAATKEKSKQTEPKRSTIMFLKQFVRLYSYQLASPNTLAEIAAS